MTNAAFKLEDSGFTRDQVDALTYFMDGSVASKADIADLKGYLKADIADLRGAMKGDIANLKAELKTDIERLEGKVIGLEGAMNAKFEKLNGRFNIVYWMFASIIAVLVLPYLKTTFG